MSTVISPDGKYNISGNTNYNRDIESAKSSGNNQLRDSDPRVYKEGFLGMDDLDRIRRRKVR